MAWGPQDCGPDGYTPDGAPCFPDTNTPPNQAAPPDPGAGGGECPPGQGILYPGGPCVGGSQTPAGNPFEESGNGDGDGWPQYFGLNRPTFNFGQVPGFKAPRFAPPTLEEAENEPGYAFARKEGLSALESSAAARGLGRTGGTYKGLIGWGNKFAEQNYGNVFNRALQTFDRLYTGALDEYRPLLAGWQTNAAANQRAGELEFGRGWDRYLADIERYKWMNPSASDLIQAELYG